MAIVLRIVSADGKKSLMKSLPALPAHIKVPAGARVEVTEHHQTMSLAQYVNEHANRDQGKEVRDDSQITVETAPDWGATEAWLDSLGALPPPDKHSAENSDVWYTGPQHDEHRVAGFQSNALLIGGAVAAGVGFGAYELTRNSKAKDTVAPAAPTGLDLATEDDDGLSSADNITTKTTGLTISGTAEAGSKVELFDGATSLGTVTASSTGAFTKDVDLAEGVHAITARATDNAGNVSAAAAVLPILTDKTAPVAPSALDLAADDDDGASSTDNITTKTSELTITGTAEAGVRVELFDGTTSLGTAVVDSKGAFTKDVALAVGVHQITAKATDPANNIGPASDSLTITVNPPTSTFTLDLATADDTGTLTNDNITSKTTGLNISGTTVANTEIELFDGASSLGKVTTSTSGTFTKAVNLAAGSHVIVGKLPSGDSSPPLTITVDTTAPTAPTSVHLVSTSDTGASDQDGITKLFNNLQFTGTAEPGTTLVLFEGDPSANNVVGSATVNASGTFTATATGASTIGEHTITAQAIDAAGNRSAASSAFHFTIDTTLPAAPIGLDLAAEDDDGTSNSDNVTSHTSNLTFSGTAEAGSTVQLIDGSTGLGTVVADATGHFTIDVSLTTGQHAITAAATDVAGNLGPASAALNVSIQAAAQASLAGLDNTDPAALSNSSSSFG